MNKEVGKVRYDRAKVLLVILIFDFFMITFALLRIFNIFSTVPFIYNISDLLWISSVTLLILSIPINKWVKFFLTFVALASVLVDEYLQLFDFYPDYEGTPLIRLFASGTFDTMDIVSYIIGFIIAYVIYYYIFAKKYDFST